MTLPNGETPEQRAARKHRNIWRLFRDLVSGGYPDNDRTMALARRSIRRGEPEDAVEAPEQDR